MNTLTVPPRRRALLELDPEILIAICRDGAPAVQLEANGLPEDVRFVGWAVGSWDKPDVLRLVVESETFESVPEYVQLPVLPAPTFRVVERAA